MRPTYSLVANVFFPARALFAELHYKMHYIASTYLPKQILTIEKGRRNGFPFFHLYLRAAFFFSQPGGQIRFLFCSSLTSDPRLAIVNWVTIPVEGGSELAWWWRLPAVLAISGIALGTITPKVTCIWESNNLPAMTQMGGGGGGRKTNKLNRIWSCSHPPTSQPCQRTVFAVTTVMHSVQSLLTTGGIRNTFLPIPNKNSSETHRGFSSTSHLRTFQLVRC